MVPTNRARSEYEGKRAVSPVIGVILMVAITVILAAVIGAFVLEIGDQQETAPSTSFDSDERRIMMKMGQGAVKTGDGKANTTQVEVTHAGGDVLDISQIRMKGDGNESVWGIDGPAAPSSGLPLADPVPDMLETFGSNDPVTFQSGQTWNAIISEGYNLDNLCRKAKYDYLVDRFDDGPDNKKSDNEVALTRDGSASDCHGGNHYAPPQFAAGDEIAVVWRASSGGKTQTLFKYTVQSGNPDYS